MKFDFNDILIQPATQTEIHSRKIINPFYDGGFLPLITAPMDTVISFDNVDLFLENKINTCLPRNSEYYKSENIFSLEFNSYSIQDFIEIFLNPKEILENKLHVLIDVANGHMKDIYDAVRQSKKLHGDKLVLMVGNIANPKTYKILSDAGANFIRVMIGNGGGCLTTEQTGIGYPNASLIVECYEISKTLREPAKIVADGGMKTYSDVIKALALGADYVMAGSIFNKALESSGPTYWHNIKLPQNDNFLKFLYKNHFNLTKKFRGMSTKEVQIAWGAEELKTSEGVVRYRPVEYTIKQWTNNFEHYLRSAMSYTNARTLQDFIGKVEYNQITNASYKRFNK